jgi:PAS domain S-box-containing protein
MWQDITERKQAEDALQKSKELLEKVFTSQLDSILVYDVSFPPIIVNCNTSTVEMFGYSRKEIIGNSMDLVLLDKSIQQYIQDNIQNDLNKKGFMHIPDLPMICKNGTIIHTELRITPLVDEHGIRNGWLSMIRDITEQKRAENEKKELETRAQLASRLATVGEMASGIAHEINNPLTSVIGFSQLLLERKAPEEISTKLTIINENAQRVASIVKRLLTFARQQKPERSMTDINDLLTTTLALRSYELETSNIKVVNQFDPDLPHTMADSNQLQQVFLNIIINAETEMKSTHGKGRLHIRTESLNNAIRISFKDDGPGMSKENLNRAFDPFFTTREVGKGTGLGLSLCHGIITEHGGSIYAKSKPGKGATFYIELPVITRPEQLKLEVPTQDDIQKISGARILIVDDEVAILSFLSRILTDEGHFVDIVDNTIQALEKIKANRYSLILLDIKLPEMSGVEFYKRIQQIAGSLTRRIVFITGDVMSKDTQDFLEKSKAAFLMKPFDTEQFKQDINRLLAQGARMSF